MQLRRFVPLAPLPGAVLVVAMYGIDSAAESTGYPAHPWPMYGSIAGWCLLLIGLMFVAPSMVTRWMAIIAAVSFVAGPANPGAAKTALFAVGFVLTAGLIVTAAAVYVVQTQAPRGRVAWSAGLTALGVGALFSFGFPSSPFLDNPGTQVWAALVVAPAAVAFGSLWRRLDRPSTLDPSKSGSPSGFIRRFGAGFVSWVIFGVAAASLGDVLPVISYPICVLLLQVFPTAVWGRTVGQLATGLQVVRVDGGGKPGWLRAAVRFVVFQSVPVLGPIYFIAWALNARIGVGGGIPERLAWDRASGTAVVRVPRPAVAAQSILRT
ncbi:MAG: RDD family protein [Chloroflexi bacterium]|nr:MAG: RDD family protein [Chloroflexota bacterium]